MATIWRHKESPSAATVHHALLHDVDTGKYTGCNAHRCISMFFFFCEITSGMTLWMAAMCLQQDPSCNSHCGQCYGASDALLCGVLIFWKSVWATRLVFKWVTACYIVWIFEYMCMCRCVYACTYVNVSISNTQGRCICINVYIYFQVGHCIWHCLNRSIYGCNMAATGVFECCNSASCTVACIQFQVGHCILHCLNRCLNRCKYKTYVWVSMYSEDTGWRRPTGCLKLQVIFRKRATNYRALLRKTP